MLAELRMQIDTAKNTIGYYQSSNMQGVLMSVIASEYAAIMHRQSMRPYSQYVHGGDCTEWVVKTLSEEAYENIVLPLMDEQFTNFCLEKKDMQIHIVKKTMKYIEKQKLLDEFYSAEDLPERYFHLKFLTPVSFKSNNCYMNMPDLRLIYQSLMNKYSVSSELLNMYDEETLEQLTAHSCVSGYRLKSTFFPLEKVKIPSFIGDITIKVSGTATLAKYIRLLLRFGEYSGVGIKTAMGMGSYEIIEHQHR